VLLSDDVQLIVDSPCIKIFFGYFVFFFFQAEDGIRDDLVTGVQTCALPILLVAPSFENESSISNDGATSSSAELVLLKFGQLGRSEERRVGQECRSRWTRGH